MSPGATSTRSIRAIRLSPDGFSSPGRQDQGAWRMGGTQRVVGLQASAAGAVGGGAQQSIGLALEPPALGCARSEVIDHQERVLGDKRQDLVEIRRARPRARQTMRGESRTEVLLQQGSQSGLEPAGRPINKQAEVSGAE